MTTRKRTVRATKKPATTISKRPAKEAPLSPKDLKPAAYNPRIMDTEAKGALKKSMEEFKDISGITWNKQTKNIVTGHHRWQGLIDLYGQDNLEFKQITPDRYAIYAEGNDTDFVLRVVDWPSIKEKQANITANSHAVEGKFTADLQELLSEIKLEMDDSLFGELRLDTLELDMQGSPHAKKEDDGEWKTDIEEVEKTESNLDGIITTIKVECSQEMRSDVFTLINTLIEEEGLAGKVKVK